MDENDRRSQGDIVDPAHLLDSPLAPPDLGPGADGRAAAVSAPKRGRGLALIVGAGVALAVALVGWRVARAVLGPKDFALDYGKLPSDTISLGRHRLISPSAYRLKEKDIPAQARWSKVAEKLCIGGDVFGTLFGEHSSYLLGEMLPIISDKENVKAALVCGKTIAEEMGSKPIFYSLAFRSGKDVHRVTMIRWSGKDLPSPPPRLKLAKDPDHLEKTRCYHPDGEPEAGPAPIPTVSAKDFDDEELKRKMVEEMLKKREGKDRDRDRDKEKKQSGDPDFNCKFAVAKVEGEDVWVSGSMSDLRAFGEEVSVKGNNKIDQGDLLKKAMSASGASVSAGVTGEKHLGFNFLGYVKDEELRTKFERATRDAKIWTHVIDETSEVWGSDRLEYKGLSESDASDLDTVTHRYMKEYIRERKDDEVDEEGSTPSTSSSGEEKTDEALKFAEIQKRVRLRAISDAEVTHTTEVVFKDEDKPTETESGVWDKFEKQNQERAGHAAKLVDQLMAGLDPADEDLKPLGPMLYSLMRPVEAAELEDSGGFVVPGGGSCTKEKSSNNWRCSYPLVAPDMPQRARKLWESKGFSVTESKRPEVPLFNGTAYDVKKGSLHGAVSFNPEGRGSVLKIKLGGRPTSIGGAEWQTDTDAALHEAKTKGTPTLLYFSAKWDAASKTINREFFASAPFLAASAKVARVSIDLTDEDDETNKLKDLYGVKSVPTVVLLDKYGTVSGHFEGVAISTDLIAKLPPP